MYQNLSYKTLTSIIITRMFYECKLMYFCDLMTAEKMVDHFTSTHTFGMNLKAIQVIYLTILLHGIHAFLRRNPLDLICQRVLMYS